VKIPSDYSNSEIQVFAEQLGQFKQITNLSVFFYRIATEEDRKCILEAIKKITNLESLIISDALFNTVDATYIIEVLKSLPNLNSIYVTGDKVNSVTLAEISKTFPNLKITVPKKF
jgi:hypothetical protein